MFYFKSSPYYDERNIKLLHLKVISIQSKCISVFAATKYDKAVLTHEMDLQEHI